MAELKPLLTDKDQIIEAYRKISKGSGCWSMWYNPKDKAFEWNEEDFEGGVELLDQILSAIDLSGNKRNFFLRIHKKPLDKGDFRYNSDYTAGFPFSLCEAGSEPEAVSGTAVYDGRGDYKMFKVMNALEGLPDKISGQISGFETRLAAIEAKPLESPIDENKRLFDMINGLMSNPQIAGLVGNVIGRVMSPFMPPQVQTVGAIGSVEAKQEVHEQEHFTPEPDPWAEIDQDILDKAEERLLPHMKLDTDLTLLADLAESNPLMFKMFLGELHKMQAK